MIAPVFSLAVLLAAVHHPAANASADPNAGYIIACILSAFTCAYIAIRKDRNPVGWLLAGALFNVLAIIVVLCASRGTYSSKPRKIADEEQAKLNQKIADIRSGKLTPFIPTGVMPVQGEQFYWEQDAQYGQTHSQRVTQGGSPALYVPLGHGFKARVGGWKASSQVVSNFMWGPPGTVYLSNIRILFKADNGEVAQAPYAEILTYDAFPDGLGLNVHGVGIVQFKTGDPCLGEAFLKIVQAPPQVELSTSTS